ncbi:MAG: hypothetical protein AABX65_01335 [Nanoarchaeota archaeon]
MPLKICSLLINTHDTDATKGMVIEGKYPDESYSCKLTNKPCVARDERYTGDNSIWLVINPRVQERCPSYKSN